VAGPVIAIQANDGTLDLNGPTNSGGPSDAQIMIADGFRGVTIRNGRLSGGSFGIYYASSTVGTRLRVENVEMTNSTHPIYVFGAELAYVLSCRVAGGDSDAIAVSGIADASYTGQFLNNVIEEVGGSAMSLGGLRAGLVRGNL